jgi:hypothetical protein
MPNVLHTGFSDPAGIYQRIIEQMERQKQQFGGVTYSGAANRVASSSINRIVNGQGMTQRVAAGLAQYEAKGNKDFVFESAEMRRELNKQITMRGGRVGNLITGEMLIADWIKSSRPQTSAPSRGQKKLMPFDAPLSRTIRPSKNPDDRVMRMLQNIADQGYVLQKAANKKV